MKKRFSDEQIISILREAEAGFLPVSSAVSTPFPTPPLYRRKKYGGMEVPEVKRLKSEEENARLKKLLAEAMLDKEAFRWLWGESTDDRPEAGSR
jgi:putative transposase